MVRIITGSIVLLWGLWLMYVLYPEGLFLTLYGLGLAGIGLAILLNKKEDEIEDIKDKNDGDT